MKCPFCAELIQDDALKCKHCGEWLLSKTYLFPTVRGKGNNRDTFVINIDGVEFQVRRHLDERIEVVKGSEAIHIIEKAKAKELHRFDLGGHTLTVQWKDAPNIVLINLLWWNTGLRLLVDGKPVEGSVDDPAERIRLASYALYFFSGIGVLTVMVKPDYAFLGIAVAIGALGLGILTKRMPLLTTSIGSLFGVYEVITYFISYGRQVVESSSANTAWYWFLFWIFLKIGATAVLVQGFIAAAKKKSLEDKFRRR